MHNIFFYFQVREFVEVETGAGNHRIGCIFSLSKDMLSVTWWREDTERSLALIHITYLRYYFQQMRQM